MDRKQQKYRRQWAIRGVVTTAAALMVFTSGVRAEEPNSGTAPGNGSTSSDAGQMKMMKDRRFATAATLGGMMEIDLGQLAQRQGSSSEIKAFAQRMVRDHQQANQELMALASRKGITLPTGMGGNTTVTTTTRSKASGGDADRRGANAAGRVETEPDDRQNPTPIGDGGASNAGNAIGTSNARNQPTVGGNRAGSVVDEDGMGLAGLGELGLRHLALEHREMRLMLASLSGQMFDQEYIGGQVKGHAKMAAMLELYSRTGPDADLRAWAAKTLPTVQEHYRMARQLAGLSGDPGRGGSFRGNRRGRDSQNRNDAGNLGNNGQDGNQAPGGSDNR